MIRYEDTMADYEKRLKIACISCIILSVLMIAVGVVIYLTLSKTLDIKFLSDLLSASGKIDTESKEVIFLFSFAPIMVGLFLLYCAYLSYARKNYYTGLVILLVACVLTILPVMNIPGLIVLPCLIGFVTWLFGSSQYEFY